MSGLRRGYSLHYKKEAYLLVWGGRLKMDKNDYEEIAKIIKSIFDGTDIELLRENISNQLADYFESSHSRKSKILYQMGMIEGWSPFKKEKFRKDCGVKELITDIDKKILSYKVNDIHKVCQTLGHSCNWEYFKDELKTYSDNDKIKLLNELGDLK